VREAELDALMARLAQGDRSAFDPLYAALRTRAARIAPDDVAQNALLKVFARASEFTPGRPCLPWFYAIVANELRAASRRSARLQFLEEPPDVASETDIEAQYVRRELERALELAIDSLDDESSSAICALLGRATMPKIPGPTFRKRVSRAYAKLRVILGGQDAR
jgi:RNA polymerase sigma-70 factor (ECF subfamily)